MRLRNGFRLPLLFPCLIFLLSLSTGRLRAQTFNTQTGRQNITSLDGLWRFHTGDNPGWADPNFDDSHWPLLRSDKNWDQQGYKGYGGFAWYRFAIETSAADRPFSLKLTGILTSYRVYADGKLIGGFGHLPPSTFFLWSRPEVFDLPHTGPHIVHIAVRV